MYILLSNSPLAYGNFILLAPSSLLAVKRSTVLIARKSSRNQITSSEDSTSSSLITMHSVFTVRGFTMPIENELIISETDYEKLSRLIDVSRSEATLALDKELSKADIRPDALMPDDIVSLYSKSHFIDIDNGSKRIVTLVMPWESSVTEMRISILSPAGIALIGERVGTVVEWPLLHNRSTKLKIIDVWAREKKRTANFH
jgi:regulator of nucleoside diphosphate kinase